MRRPRLVVILPKLSMVSFVKLNPFVGSQTLFTVPPFPSGTPETLALQLASNLRKISLLLGVPTSTLVGYAWLKMLKNPDRNWMVLLSLILKFLKNETSKLLRLGKRM